MATAKRRKGDQQGEAAYRRRSRPVRVRQSLFDSLRLPWRPLALGVLAIPLAVAGGVVLRDYVKTDPRFELPALDGVVVTGLDRVPAGQVLAAFVGDQGRSLLEIPLADRRAALAALPWLRRASVTRRWPNRLWVHVAEREPAAFVLVPDGAEKRPLLVDSEGVLLEPPAGERFNLPVAEGLTAAMPQPERARRVERLLELLRELDEGLPPYAERIDQVNLGELDNLRALTLHEGDVIELQLGDGQYRHRFEVFLKYINSWKRQYGTVGSVDLRFEGQVVIQPLTAAASLRRGGR